jgi:hypothetical protein
MTDSRDSDLTAAIRALVAEGRPTTHQAVLDWLARHGRRSLPPPPAAQEPRTAQTCEAPRDEPQPAPPVASRPAPSAAENKRGRPPRVASWFPAVAKTMADGTTLRMALLLNSIRLDACEIRRLYRLVEFRRLYSLERRMYQLQKWGRIPQDELERTRKRLLARIL